MNFDFKTLIDNLYVAMKNDSNFSNVTFLSSVTEVDSFFPSLVIDKESDMVVYDYNNDSLMTTKTVLKIVLSTLNTSDRDLYVGRIINFFYNYDFVSEGFTFDNTASISIGYDNFLNSDNKNFYVTTILYPLKRLSV